MFEIMKMFKKSTKMMCVVMAIIILSSMFSVSASALTNAKTQTETFNKQICDVNKQISKNDRCVMCVHIFYPKIIFEYMKTIASMVDRVLEMISVQDGVMEEDGIPYTETEIPESSQLLMN